jgi:hypothetical protein
LPTLDKKFFAGESDIPMEECAKLEIRNVTTDLEQCLREFGWQGGTAACIALSLSADNGKVARGEFVLVGPLADYKEEAAKLWPGCNENVTMTNKMKTGAVFSFENGSLASEIVAQEKLEYAYYDQGTIILDVDYEEYGIGDFCARTVCSISKNSAVKEKCSSNTQYSCSRPVKKSC